MTGDRVSKIIEAYEAGSLTEGSACLELLLVAGEGNAEAIYARLPPDLQVVVSRSVFDGEPSEVRIFESYCGPLSPAAYSADLRRREDLMRQGIFALRRVVLRTSDG